MIGFFTHAAMFLFGFALCACLNASGSADSHLPPEMKG